MWSPTSLSLNLSSATDLTECPPYVTSLGLGFPAGKMGIDLHVTTGPSPNSPAAEELTLCFLEASNMKMHQCHDSQSWLHIGFTWEA